MNKEFYYVESATKDFGLWNLHYQIEYDGTEKSSNTIKETLQMYGEEVVTKCENWLEIFLPYENRTLKVREGQTVTYNVKKSYENRILGGYIEVL